MKRLVTRLGGLCCAVTLLCCGCSAPGSPVSSVPQAELSAAAVSGAIGICKAPEALQLYGYPDFYEDGYTAQMKEYSDPAQPLRDLLAGQLSFCEAPLSSVIQARTEGEPVVILCNLTGRGIAVVAGTDTGLNTLADLPGRRVGYTPGTTGYVLTLLALREESIDPASVEWIEILPDEANEALQSGKLDAYCGTAYTAGEAILGGYVRVISYLYQEGALGTANQVMVTTEAVVSEKRDWLQQMVDTHRQATENFRENYDFYLQQAEALGMNRECIAVERDNIELLWDIEEEYSIQHFIFF